MNELYIQIALKYFNVLLLIPTQLPIRECTCIQISCIVYRRVFMQMKSCVTYIFRVCISCIPQFHSLVINLFLMVYIVPPDNTGKVEAV